MWARTIGYTNSNSRNRPRGKNRRGLNLRVFRIPHLDTSQLVLKMQRHKTELLTAQLQRCMSAFKHGKSHLTTHTHRHTHTGATANSIPQPFACRDRLFQCQTMNPCSSLSLCDTLFHLHTLKYSASPFSHPGTPPHTHTSTHSAGRAAEKEKVTGEK